MPPDLSEGILQLFVLDKNRFGNPLKSCRMNYKLLLYQQQCYI